MRGSRSFKIQRIVYRQSHLVRNQPKKANFVLGIRVRTLTGKKHAPDAAMHRGQWKHAHRLHPVFFQCLDRFGEASLTIHKWNHERPLVLKHPAGHGFFPGAIFRRAQTGFIAMNRHMPLDGIVRFIVLSDAYPVKFDDAAQFIDKDFEKLFRFAEGANSLRDTDERLVARGYRLLQRLKAYLRHSTHGRLDAANGQMGSFGTAAW